MDCGVVFIVSHFTHFTFNRHRSFKCLFVILCPHILNRIVCSIESINLCLQTSETGYDSLCFSFEFDARLTEEMTSYDAMQFVCVFLCSCWLLSYFFWMDWPFARWAVIWSRKDRTQLWPRRWFIKIIWTIMDPDEGDQNFCIFAHVANSLLQQLPRFKNFGRWKNLINLLALPKLWFCKYLGSLQLLWLPHRFVFTWAAMGAKGNGKSSSLVKHFHG